MQRESQTLSTVRKDPQIVIEGMEEVLERDLKKHEGLLARTETEMSEYQSARIYEKNRRKHYEGLIGGGKFNDTALKGGIAQCVINMRHMGDKIKLSKEKIEHHAEIIVRLKQELQDQYAGLKTLKEYRENGAAN